MTRLEHAICEAHRIRRNLVRLRGDTDLGGDCGLASVLLADAIRNPASLRGVKEAQEDPSMTHVWNTIDGVIIDITASQFNDNLACDAVGEAPVFGVLVTTEPRLYHHPVQMRGLQVLDFLVTEEWYPHQEQRRIQAAAARLATRSRRFVA